MTKEGVFPPLLSLVLPFLVVAIPALIYLQGLPGGFEFDDGINIVKNEHIRIESLDYESLKNAALSTSSGPLRRPVAMLSFAINYYFSQESVVGYKIVNIGIHALNALLVYLLSLLLLRRQAEYINNAEWCAFGVAVLWSLLPINLTSVLYIIQRMVSLGATFALLAIICWFHARQMIERSGRVSALLVGLFLLNYVLAVLCKETYILTGLVVIFLDIFVFSRGNRLEKTLKKIQITGLCLASVLVLVILLYKPELIVGDFSQRPFDMTERLLTQFRVIVFYLGLIVFPSNLHLGLYHDDFQLSQGLFDPITTLVSIAVVLSVLVYALRKRRTQQLMYIGVFWFFCWHLLESSILSLELVHEHRNYLASVGIVWLGLQGLGLLGRVVASKAMISLVVLMIFALNASVTSLRAREWSDLVDHALAEVDHHPNSVRAKYQLGRVHLIVYYENRDKAQLNYSYTAFSEAANLSDYDLLPLFGVIRVGLLLGVDIGNTVNDLSYKFRHAKIPASTIVALSDFQECIKAKQCEGLEEFYLVLVDALISNPSLDEESLSQLYRLKASYISEVEGSYDRAYLVLRQAIQALPLDYQLRKSVLYYYVITVKLDAADRELEKFQADFADNHDTKRIVREVCDIFKERGYKPGCDFVLKGRSFD